MRILRLLAGCVLSVTLYGCATSPTLEPNRSENPVLAERLKNAQINNKRLSNGATITEVKFAGSLKPNVELGCIAMSDVRSAFNPPALIYAAKRCIEQGEYEKAWALIITSNGYAYYDLQRLADRSARGARRVLSINAFADLEKDRRIEARWVSKAIQGDAEKVTAYCAELARIGPPTYEPLWAILHGIGVYDEPRDGHYLTNVDTKALWDEVVNNRCNPKKP